MDPKDITIPFPVPEQLRGTFLQNYNKATADTGRLFLFAGDQKVEHLNKDFYGTGIDPEAADPQHLFQIASKGRIGAFATHLGLIARYAEKYRTVRYVVKLNGKTDLVPTKIDDPISCCWTSVASVVSFKAQTGLDIVGVGMTVYLGSRYESQMLATAADVIVQSHQHGLLTILWMYPRGVSVDNERQADIIAGAAGVAVSLGADFVKVNAPDAADSLQSAQFLRIATTAAGNTRVICSGGPRKNDDSFLQSVYQQIHVGGVMGAAVGRNIYQRSTQNAIAFCNALATIIFDDGDVNQAKQFLE